VHIDTLGYEINGRSRKEKERRVPGTVAGGLLPAPTIIPPRKNGIYSTSIE